MVEYLPWMCTSCHGIVTHKELRGYYQHVTKLPVSERHDGFDQTMCLTLEMKPGSFRTVTRPLHNAFLNEELLGKWRTYGVAICQNRYCNEIMVSFLAPKDIDEKLDAVRPKCVHALIEDARRNAYRVVSDNDFYPLPAVAIPGTDYLVPEIAIATIEYLLKGTPTNGASVYFDLGAEMDPNKMTVMSLVLTGIDGLGEDLELMPDSIIDRMSELKQLQDMWIDSHQKAERP